MKIVQRTFQILEETPDWIVVNKPPNLQVHPSKPDGSFTMWDGLKELLAFEIVNGGQISIINRLDRETSGITLVCKNRDTARKFSMLMEERKISKEYLTIVWGWPELDHFEVNAPIARQGEHSHSDIWLKQIVHPKGSPSHTRFHVERRFEKETTNGSRFSLIRAYPMTGRMHQIRVHLSYMGHPVVGDKIYGPNEQNYLEFIETGWTQKLGASLLLPRHALHSCLLRVEKENLEWSAPLFDDMAYWLAS